MNQQPPSMLEFGMFLEAPLGRSKRLIAGLPSNLEVMPVKKHVLCTYCFLSGQPNICNLLFFLYFNRLKLFGNRKSGFLIIISLIMCAKLPGSSDTVVIEKI